MAGRPARGAHAAGAAEREIADGVEGGAPIDRQLRSDERPDLSVQSVNARIRVLPAVRQRGRIEPSKVRTDRLEIEKAGAFRHEQTNGELNRRDMLHHLEPLDRVEELAVAGECQTRMEGHTRRN